MRRVATHLGVDPMALDRHFRDKGAVLGAFVDDVFAGIDLDVPEGLEGVKVLTRRYFDALVEHPGLVGVDLGHSTTSPHQLAVAERLYAGMLEGGLDVPTAHLVYTGLQRLVLGSALVYPRRSAADDPDEWSRVRELFSALDPADFPALRAINEQVPRRRQRDIVEDWIDALVDHPPVPRSD